MSETVPPHEQFEGPRKPVDLQTYRQQKIEHAASPQGGIQNSHYPSSTGSLVDFKHFKETRELQQPPSSKELDILAQQTDLDQLQSSIKQLKEGLYQLPPDEQYQKLVDWQVWIGARDSSEGQAHPSEYTSSDGKISCHNGYYSPDIFAISYTDNEATEHTDHCLKCLLYREIQNQQYDATADLD